MDPESGPKNTVIIDFQPIDFDRNRIFFEENSFQKLFYLGHFNDCDNSLVTCKATFSNDYNLIACELMVILLDKDYQSLLSKENELSLDDLFKISETLNEYEKFILVYNKKLIKSVATFKEKEIDTPIQWIIDSALKEDKEKYMDINDKMIDYIGSQVEKRKCYKSTEPFVQVEKCFKGIQKKVS